MCAELPEPAPLVPTHDACPPLPSLCACAPVSCLVSSHCVPIFAVPAWSSTPILLLSSAALPATISLPIRPRPGHCCGTALAAAAPCNTSSCRSRYSYREGVHHKLIVQRTAHQQTPKMACATAAPVKIPLPWEATPLVYRRQQRACSHSSSAAVALTLRCAGRSCRGCAPALCGPGPPCTAQGIGRLHECAVLYVSKQHAWHARAGASTSSPACPALHARQPHSHLPNRPPQPPLTPPSPAAAHLQGWASPCPPPTAWQLCAKRGGSMHGC